MDASNRIAFITGKLIVPAEVITPDEWLEILRAALAEVKPYLPYLQGFDTLGSAQNIKFNNQHERATPPNIVKYDQGLCGQTKILLVFTKSEYANYDTKLGVYLELRVAEILLTPKGGWVHSVATYRREVVPMESFRSDEGILETATSQEFTFLDDAQLLRLMCEKVGMKILSALYKAMTDTEERLSQRSKAIARAGESIYAMIKRM